MDVLKGKVAYVSGGAVGIGAAIAQTFAKEGAAVAIGDVQYDEAQKVAVQICAEGGKAIAIRHDVTEEEQWVSALDKTLATFSGLDILVNNAAVEQTRPLVDVLKEDVQRMIDVNVMGNILGHKHAAAIMKPGGRAGKGGGIINLSSVAGLIGTMGLGIYSATKGAVRLLSKCAAVEFGQLGYDIRVNAIFPGYVDTDMGRNLVKDFVNIGMFPDLKTAHEQVLLTYPLGRTGVPQDIANSALFLASEQSSWMTGGEIVLDGGMTIC